MLQDSARLIPVNKIKMHKNLSFDKAESLHTSMTRVPEIALDILIIRVLKKCLNVCCFSSSSSFILNFYCLFIYIFFLEHLTELVSAKADCDHCIGKKQPRLSETKSEFSVIYFAQLRRENITSQSQAFLFSLPSPTDDLLFIVKVTTPTICFD